MFSWLLDFTKKKSSSCKNNENIVGNSTKYLWKINFVCLVVKKESAVSFQVSF